MLKDLLTAIFRRTPRQVRNFCLRLGHARFTVTVGGYVTDGQGRVLLLKHVFRAGSGWGVPGGFVDAGEQPEQALRREVREEVGLELESAKPVLIRTFHRPRQIEIVFCCRSKGKPQTRSLEVREAAWFPLDKLPETLPSDQRSLINRVVADRANGLD